MPRESCGAPRGRPRRLTVVRDQDFGFGHLSKALYAAAGIEAATTVPLR